MDVRKACALLALCWLAACGSAQESSSSALMSGGAGGMSMSGAGGAGQGGSAAIDAAAGEGGSTQDGAASPIDDGGTDANQPLDGSGDDAGTIDDSAADIAYDAFTELFYTVSDGKGYYVNDSGTATANHWWTQAELIEMAIDAYERKPSDAYRTLMIELVYGFVAVQGTDWTYNDFNDDIAWMVIASLRAHANTGNEDFLAYAKSNWDAMYARAWDTMFFGGGLWWKVGEMSKNACINGPGAIGAFLLYKATGEGSYLDKAKAIYAWERGALFDGTTGAVYDNVNPTNGGDDWTFTYNSGTFIGIANYLYQETGDDAYLEDATLAADFFMNELSDDDGLIRENDITGDGAAFKAIGFRWLAKLVRDNGLEATYLPWLQYNANRAWANRRGDHISWNDWREATPHMILDSTGASATVQILQVVPPGGEQLAWYNSAPQDGRAHIEAERCDEKRGMTIEASEGGSEQLGGITGDAWARYAHVDFGVTAPTMFRARAAVDASAGGSIEVRIDRVDGPLIGTCPVRPTGVWTMYEDFSAPISAVTGTHDVYLVFKTGLATTYVANLNWFQLQ
jgi:hypothetical protein